MYIVINQIIQAISLSTFTRRNVNSFLHSFFRPDFDVEDDLVVVVSESFSDSDKILWSTCEVYNYGLFHIHQRDWQVMKSKESQTKWTLIRMKYLFQTKNLLSTIPPQNSFYKTDIQCTPVYKLTECGPLASVPTVFLFRHQLIIISNFYSTLTGPGRWICSKKWRQF